MTYSEILAKLEAATGPDREIDVLVRVQIMPVAHRDGLADIWSRAVAGDEDARRFVHYTPPYTASLDAVVALIESELPGWVRSVSGRPKDEFDAWVWGPSRGDDFFDADIDMFEARAATEPLALLTAAIRALVDKEAA